MFRVSRSGPIPDFVTTTSMPRRVRPGRWLLTGLVTLVVLGCCAALIAARATRHRHVVATATVAVTVQNFRIDIPPVLQSGTIRFVVTNLGPTMHEFNVARTDLAPANVPMKADGILDDTDPHQNFTHLAEVEGIDIGQHKTLTVQLSPGQYVVYCNMDGHVAAGMVEQITVIA